MKRWRRFLALDAAQRAVFLWSVALLPVIAIAVRWRGLARAQAFISGVPAPQRTDLAPVDATRMVNAAAWAMGVSCLPRSLVLWRLVHARGATIRLGVARSAQDGLAAHAWVELDGRPLNDRSDVYERFAVLPAVEDASRAGQIAGRLS